MADQRYVTLVSAAPALHFTAMRADTPAAPEGGFGGWASQTRPRRKSLTVWGGIEPYAVALPLLLGVTAAGDGVPHGRSCEADCLALERMAMPASEGSEPPLIQAIGGLPGSVKTWVISGIDWNTDLAIWSTGGFRMRQPVTVHLLEYVADDRVATSPAAAQARQKAVTAAATAARAAGTPAKAKTYTVKAGDTLSKIAASQLGSYKRYPEIAALNGISVSAILHPGQKLRLS